MRVLFGDRDPNMRRHQWSGETRELGLPPPKNSGDPPENSRHSPVLPDRGIVRDVRSIRSHNKRSCQLSTSAWWREVNIVRCGLMSLELHRLRRHDRFLDLGEKSWWLADKIEDDARVCLPPCGAMDRDQLTGSLWSPQRSTHPARRFYMLRYITCDQVLAPFIKVESKYNTIWLNWMHAEKGIFHR